MNEKNMTALVSCFSRAYHNKNSKTKIYGDDVAEKILSPQEYESISYNMANGIKFFNPNFEGSKKEALEWIVNNNLAPSVLARSAFTARTIKTDKKAGLKQYLIFASGYDTYAYTDRELQCYEIDRAEMIDDKISRIKNAGIDASNVQYIKADFTQRNWETALINSNIDFGKKIFCSLLGISYYLTKDEFYNMIKKISALMQKGSTIVFDYPIPDDSEKERINRALAKGANEEMKSKYTYNELEITFQEYDLLIYEHLNDKDINEQYFKEYNQKSTSKIFAPKGINYCLSVKQ